MILTWGSSYYLMAVLAEAMAYDTGWSLQNITAALSAGLLTAGLASPLVGRRIERHGGRPVLAAGALLIAAGLLILALSPNLLTFWAAWLVIGLGMAAGLYDPAFATLGQLFGRDARRAITQLTLWGGFASTVCWPLSAWMLENLGWRGTALAYACIHLAITVPIIWWGLPSIPGKGTAKSASGQKVLSLTPQERQKFWLFGSMQAVHALIMVNMAVWLFSFLQAQGIESATAVAIGMLMGPAQVAARIFELASRERHHPLWTLTASVILVALGLLLMAGTAGWAAIALMIFGAGNGLYSIARGALPLALFGEDRYAQIIGQLARPWHIAQAAAPTLGAITIASWGAKAAIYLLLALAALNLVFQIRLWQAAKP